MRYWCLIIGLLIPLGIRAQEAKRDSIPEARILKAVDDTLVPVLQKVLRPDQLAALPIDSMPVTFQKSGFQPSPRKAVIYSLILPGLGQIYNRNYWKVPFVYAGIGGALYTVRWNSVRYKAFLEPYLKAYDASGRLIGDLFPVFLHGEGITRDLNIDQIKRGKTYYRRFRGYGVIICGLVYALAAVEANVAAHLKNFNANMNEDLTLRLEPASEPTLFAQQAQGVKLVLSF